MTARPVRLGPVGEGARARVRERRLARGISLRELSDRMPSDARLGHSSISDIEHGFRRITVDDLVALAGALDVEPGYLIGERT